MAGKRGSRKTAAKPSRRREMEFVNRLPVGIYRTTAQGRIVEANQALAEMLGYEKAGDLKDVNAADLYADPAVRSGHLRAADRSDIHTTEFELKRRDGRTVWVQDFIRAVKTSRGTVRFYDGVLENISERRQAVEALQASQTRLRALIEGLPDLMFIMDLKGTILDYWAERPDMLHLPPDAFLGRPVYGFLPPGIAALAEQRLQQAVGTRSVQRFEFSMPDSPPTGRNFEGRMKVLDERQVVLFLRDITEEKKAEKTAVAVFKISDAVVSSRSLDDLFRSIHGIIGELMPAQNIYIALTDPAGDVLSFPYFVDEFDEAPAPRTVGRGLTEYVLRTGRPLLASAAEFRALEEKGEIEPIGTDPVDWLGVPLILGGRTIGVLAVQSYREGVRYSEKEQDILRFVSGQVAMAIRRKQDEETLQERERFLSSVFDSIQDGISVLDLEMRILRVNRVMTDWYAHVTPLEGKKCYEAYQGRDRICEICPTSQALETGKAAYTVRPRTGPRGEVTGWLDLFSFPLVDRSSGRIFGVIEYVRDITDRKKAEEALKASLQEKEVLLREIHHRVKNNMQVISSLLNLQAHHVGGEALKEAIQASQRRIHSMSLVHEKLYMAANLARIEFGEYMRSLAGQLIKAFNPDPSRIRLNVEAEAVFLNINTAVPCGLIVNELVSNAVKHAFPGTRRGRIDIGLKRAGENRFLLTVRDDGVGIPETVDFRASQTLGLQIVTTLISQVDGEIELVRNQGSEFRLLFREIIGKSPV